ncbi:MAG: YqjF family protein [Rufibacter sp.]
MLLIPSAKAENMHPSPLQKTFLQVEWRKLIMANYKIDPSLLAKYLPAGTELDFWNGTCYVSLVGFLFLNTRVKGIAVPFHTNFEEVNLRFYVKRQEQGTYKRGVVFLKEIVLKPALAWVANTLYGEHYETRAMRHFWTAKPNALEVGYGWKNQQWYHLKVTAAPTPVPIGAGTEAEFIIEHYWGYTQRGRSKTSAYEVTHPRWEVYPVKNFSIDVDFGLSYGPDFSGLTSAAPVSVFLAEGSAITVKEGGLLSL